MMFAGFLPTVKLFCFYLEEKEVSGRFLNPEIGNLCNTASLVLKREEESFSVIEIALKGLYYWAKLNHTGKVYAGF